MDKLPLHTQIFIALILAATVGALTDPQTQIFGIIIYDVLDFLANYS